MKKDFLESSPSFSSEEAKKVWKVLSSRADNLIYYRQKTNDFKYFNLVSGINLDWSLEKNKDIIELGAKLNNLMNSSNYSLLKGLANPDFEKEDKEAEKVKDVQGGKVHPEKMWKSKTIIDLCNKYLEKAAQMTPDEFYEFTGNSPHYMFLFLNRILSLCKNPFISKELAMKTFDVYEGLFLKMIEDGRIIGSVSVKRDEKRDKKEGFLYHNGNGFIFPAVYSSDSKFRNNSLDMFAPLISEEDDYKGESIDMFQPFSGNKFEEEKLYDDVDENQIKEMKHRQNEEVLNRISQFRKDVLSRKVFEKISFKNPIWELVRRGVCFCNDYRAKVKDAIESKNISFKDTISFWGLIAIDSLVCTPIKLMDCTLWFVYKFFSIFRTGALTDGEGMKVNNLML